MVEAQQFVSIVIVDDNPSHLEFVAAALASPGRRILTSTDPEEALALINTHRPEIVLTDVLMPGMNGLQVLRVVKKLDPNIDVVLMSANDLPQTGDNAECQATDYLRKPISIARLRTCVADIIEKHHQSHQQT